MLRAGASVSALDHFYDKLLHIGRPERLRSQNPYILEEAQRRSQFAVGFVLGYWHGLRGEEDATARDSKKE